MGTAILRFWKNFILHSKSYENYRPNIELKFKISFSSAIVETFVKSGYFSLLENQFNFRKSWFLNSPWHQLKIQSKIYPRSLWDLRRLWGIFSSDHPRSYENFLIISQESSLILGNECVSDSGKTFLEDLDRTSALISLDLLRFLGELARSEQNFCQNLPRKSSQNLRRIRFQDSGKILGRWSENSDMIWDDLMIKSLIIF